MGETLFETLLAGSMKKATPFASQGLQDDALQAANRVFPFSDNNCGLQFGVRSTRLLFSPVLYALLQTFPVQLNLAILANLKLLKGVIEVLTVMGGDQGGEQ